MYSFRADGDGLELAMTLFDLGASCHFHVAGAWKCERRGCFLVGKKLIMAIEETGQSTTLEKEKGGNIQI